ncbi:MAG TPA: Ig-like domain-containing protein [Gemmatimonadales bacterium]|nr:Ig-like domain-containing protein [Gemmatimonadales bacterium]
MRQRRALLLTLLVGACGGGDSGTNSPPPPATVASIDIALSNPNISVGGTSQATAVLKDASGNQLSGRTVAWSSSNASIASVGSTGLITALSAGSTTITGNSGGISGSATLTVGPPPVASVTVTLASGTLIPGATTTAQAQMRDAAGTALAGRQVTWNSTNSSVATVSASGQVTAVTAGTTSITATSEGKTGSAQLVVTEPPVATVHVFGTERVKVGDPYQLTVEARLADGTLVQRPILWSVPVPGSLTISTAGVLTALQSGTLDFSVTVGGVTANATVTAYDWSFSSVAQRTAVEIPADIQITNKHGTSEYPTLVISCFQGTMLLYVDTDHFVTANGLVSYSFNGGTPLSSNWVEFDNFSGLGHPGPTNLVVKNFVSLIASSSLFGFAFTEFQSVARATVFRVSGLTPYLSQVLAACPSNTLRADATSVMFSDILRSTSTLRGDTLMEAERARRSVAGPVPSAAPHNAISRLQPPARVLLTAP